MLRHKAPGDWYWLFQFFSLVLLYTTKNNIVVVVAQETSVCAATCPPLVNGVPVPSICEGDSIVSSDNDVTTNVATRSYTSCHPAPTRSFSLSDYLGTVVVIANHYTGCSAGRRESGIYAHVAQRYYDKYQGDDRVLFLVSLKGGANCESWASLFQSDAEALYPNVTTIVPNEAPTTVLDTEFELRDDFFTTPFPHPSYVVLDRTGVVRHKFVGPCCGYVSYYDCDADVALQLDTQLSGYVDALLAEEGDGDVNETPDVTTIPPTLAPTASTTTTTPTCPDQETLIEDGYYSTWSPCTTVCPLESSRQYRTLTDPTDECVVAAQLAPVQERPCPFDVYELPNCANLPDVCVPEFGRSSNIVTVATNLASPRDVAFHPTPGLHLGNYSEGRSFNGDSNTLEAWVANGGNHSVSIITNVGTTKQTTLSRRDRGYYHYNINMTALSFNSVRDSGRSKDRDSVNYWASCNDNRNDYLGSKQANYFMGPTLYNSDPANRNTVNRLGEACDKEDQPCYFLHSDMLHEAPACVGIVHDPEVKTAWGNVYWAFDATGDNSTSGQLVRFDFQQPHGPGSMDHSVAAVRRYPEVKLQRGVHHSGMVIDNTGRYLYVVNPGAGTVVRVGLDTGTFARTAREEFPIFSNRLPSFEYSIWECVEVDEEWVNGLDAPSGAALSADGERLYVAEYKMGKIKSYETSSGALLGEIDTGSTGVGGLALANDGSDTLYYVSDGDNSLHAIIVYLSCEADSYPSHTNAAFTDWQSQEENYSLHQLRRDPTCLVDPVVPSTSFFDQVHVDSGYASNDTNVQSNMTGMDANAALLANRTDCGVDDELNFDALLLGGFFCHRCLPAQAGADCDRGGTCANVQWRGYTCDNEYVLTLSEDKDELVLSTTDGVRVDPATFLMKPGVDYRITVKTGANETVTLMNQESAVSLPGNECGCATEGPLLLSLENLGESVGNKVVLKTSSGHAMEIGLEGTSAETDVDLVVEEDKKEEEEEEEKNPEEQEKNTNDKEEKEEEKNPEEQEKDTNDKEEEKEKPSDNSSCFVLKENIVRFYIAVIVMSVFIL